MAKQIPAGWFRDFAFTRWPSFIEKRWNYIRRQAASRILQPQQRLIFASDTDSEACHKLESCIQNYNLNDTVAVRQIDFFELDPRDVSDRTGTVCINPPYGRRLGGKQESEEFFHAVGEKLRQAYRGWKLVLIAPSRQTMKSFQFQMQSIPIWHGGLKLRLLIGKIK